MACFKFALVLCVLVFGQAYASAIEPVPQLEGKLLDLLIWIVNTVEHDADKLLALIAKSVNDILANLPKIETTVTKIVELVLGFVDHIAHDALEAVRKNFNKQTGFLIDCLEEEGKNVEADILNITKKGLTCVDPYIGDIVKVIPPIVTQLQGVQAKVEAITADLKKCDGDAIHEAACVADIGTKVLNLALAELPPIIQKALKDFQAVIHTTCEGSKGCFKEIAVAIKNDVIARIDSFSTCVYKHC